MMLKEGASIAATNIRCVIFDLDGVLTDGAIYLDERGIQHRRYHVHDGMGIKLLEAAGLEVAVITTTPFEIIESRMKQLNIKHCYTGNKNKLKDFEHLKQKLNLNNEQFAYMGDDFPDLLLLKKVGFPATVANAIDDVQEQSMFISSHTGGNGAVREFCHYLLSTQSLLESAMSQYLQS